MKKTDQLLAAKYQSVVINEAYGSTSVQRLVDIFYKRLASTSYAEVTDIIREIVQVVKMISRDSVQEEMYYDMIMQGIGQKAIDSNRIDIIQRISDMAKIMKSGLGINKPGLN